MNRLHIEKITMYYPQKSYVVEPTEYEKQRKTKTNEYMKKGLGEKSYIDPIWRD
jgi:hypothetical protein